MLIGKSSCRFLEDDFYNWKISLLGAYLSCKMIDLAQLIQIFQS
jgi:hypothetical protein